MTDNGTVEIIARDISPEIMRLLVSEAQHHDVTAQERAVSILALAFRVKRQTPKRRFARATDSNTLVLSVPTILRQRIRKRAFESGGTMRVVVCAELASHFGLPDVSLARRPRGNG